MEYSVREVRPEDASAIAAIFNHFVATSFAAFPQQPVDDSFLGHVLRVAGGLPVYVIEMPDYRIIGFAMLRPFEYGDTLSRTAEIVIFIRPEHTRNGLGQRVLQMMEEAARVRGIDTLLGCASSLNIPSIRFQEKNGYNICGLFKRVGRKFGQDYDVVWLQKFLF